MCIFSEGIDAGLSASGLLMILYSLFANKHHLFKIDVILISLPILDLLAHIKLMQTTFAPHGRLLVHSLFKTHTELYIKVYALCHSFNHFTHGWLHVQDNDDDYALL